MPRSLNPAEYAPALHNVLRTIASSSPSSHTLTFPSKKVAHGFRREYYSLKKALRFALNNPPSRPTAAQEEKLLEYNTEMGVFETYTLTVTAVDPLSGPTAPHQLSFVSRDDTSIMQIFAEAAANATTQWNPTCLPGLSPTAEEQALLDRAISPFTLRERLAERPTAPPEVVQRQSNGQAPAQPTAALETEVVAPPPQPISVTEAPSPSPTETPPPDAALSAAILRTVRPEEREAYHEELLAASLPSAMQQRAALLANLPPAPSSLAGYDVLFPSAPSEPTEPNTPKEDEG